MKYQFQGQFIVAQKENNINLVTVSNRFSNSSKIIILQVSHQGRILLYQIINNQIIEILVHTSNPIVFEKMYTKSADNILSNNFVSF